MPTLDELLGQSAAMHHHLCPRQVLGVRMGLLAGRELGLDLPQTGKRLLTIIETDGCFADGVSVATGCWIGHRTLRIEDYGKVAATFVDTDCGQTVRIAPHPGARALSRSFAPEARNRWEAQLLGYQRMPLGDLFTVQRVELTTSIEAIVSQAGLRAVCDTCGEEIINGREIVQDGKVFCRACLFGGYYTALAVSTPSAVLLLNRD
jgi:formylmethanofuran dehydrogenase subunit E